MVKAVQNHIKGLNWGLGIQDRFDKDSSEQIYSILFLICFDKDEMQILQLVRDPIATEQTFVDAHTIQLDNGKGKVDSVEKVTADKIVIASYRLGLRRKTKLPWNSR